MFKTFAMLLIGSWSAYVRAAHSENNDAMFLGSFCDDFSPETLDFQQLFTGTIDSMPSAEVWLDRSESRASGIVFLNTKKDFRHLSGSISKDKRIVLCEYKKSAKRPEAIYFGKMLDDRKIEAKRIVLSKPKNAEQIQLVLADAQGGAGSPFDIAYHMTDDVFEIQNINPLGGPIYCFINGSFFQLHPSKPSSVLVSINKRIEDLFKHLLTETMNPADCQKEKSPPRKEGLRIAKMFLSSKHLSAKVVQYSAIQGRNNLEGRTLNIDLATGEEIALQSLILEKFHAKILSALQNRLTVMFGTYGRLSSLKDVNFSFNRYGIVFSFAPVDATGWYLPVFYVEIPISLVDFRSAVNPAGPLALR